ncbi:hypothetical protein DOTSEDRAFT_68129 [Dothistroma septosporum NZE10]|uniref:Uncharacterized protein n=1 Tax=Dothistroma septosporum (strain NZE10 / CBS 128990) TaxID=675120 RepID=N1Q1X4_DOTSN|nr:hypothetical protein DOTSEDRAFT_68129 [Dothistroma septosporum NZE10]
MDSFIAPQECETRPHFRAPPPCNVDSNQLAWDIEKYGARFPATATESHHCLHLSLFSATGNKATNPQQSLLPGRKPKYNRPQSDCAATSAGYART